MGIGTENENYRGVRMFGIGFLLGSFWATLVWVVWENCFRWQIISKRMKRK